jgi:hypothetical protein
MQYVITSIDKISMLANSIPNSNHKLLSQMQTRITHTFTTDKIDFKIVSQTRITTFTHAHNDKDELDFEIESRYALYESDLLHFMLDEHRTRKRKTEAAVREGSIEGCAHSLTSNCRGIQ